MEEKYLILLQVVSAGQNGVELGVDEEQIVYLLYAVLDVEQNKVRQFDISQFWFRYETLSVHYMCRKSDNSQETIDDLASKVINSGKESKEKDHF